MLKKTETEETIVFLGDIFIIGSISIGGGRAPWAPLAAPMLECLEMEVYCTIMFFFKRKLESRMQTTEPNLKIAKKNLKIVKVFLLFEDGKGVYNI